LRVRGASVACINKYDKGCIFLSNRVRRSIGLFNLWSFIQCFL